MIGAPSGGAYPHARGDLTGIRFGRTATETAGALGMHRRALLVALFVLTPTLAMADESISGQWQANLGHNVIIAMDVLADGYWTSQTVENNKVVAQMAGSYEQDKSSATTGTLVFTPVKAKTTAEHGAAEVEHDKYTLEQGGKVLRLVSGKNEPMVFHKQAYAK